MAAGVEVGALFATLSLDKSKFDGAVSSSGTSLGNLAKSAATAGLAIGAAFIGFGIAAAHSADEQERADLRVRQVFGDTSAEFIAWTQKRSLALKVNDDVLEMWGAKAVTTFKSMGLSMATSTTMTQALMERAADISASTGKSFEEVFAALLKGTTGATKGLKDLGIVVDTNAIKQEAMNLGLYSGEGALSASAKAAAIYSLELKGSADMAGAAGERAGSMGEMLKTIPVIFDQVMDAAGTAFLPLITAILPGVLAAFQGLSDWVTANLPTIKAVAETVVKAIGVAFGFLTDTVIPALGEVFGWITTNVLPPLQAVFGEVTSKGLPALGGAFDFITKTVVPALGKVFDWIRVNILPPLQSIFNAFTTNILPILGKAFAYVSDFIRDNWPMISTIIGGVANAVKLAFDGIAAVINFVAPIISKVADVLFPALGFAGKILLNTLGAIFAAIGDLFNTVAGIAKTMVDLIGAAWTGLTGVFKTVWDGITGIIKTGINFVIGLINGIIGAINSIQVHIGRIGIDVPGVGFVGVGPFDWWGLRIPRMAYLAAGARDFAGGLARLGETGPETAFLPRGTSVTTAADTEAIVAAAKVILGGQQGSRPGPVIGTQIIQGLLPNEVDRQTTKALDRAAFRWALGG